MGRAQHVSCAFAHLGRRLWCAQAEYSGLWAETPDGTLVKNSGEIREHILEVAGDSGGRRAETSVDGAETPVSAGRRLWCPFSSLV